MAFVLAVLENIPVQNQREHSILSLSVSSENCPNSLISQPGCSAVTLSFRLLSCPKSLLTGNNIQAVENLLCLLLQFCIAEPKIQGSALREILSYRLIIILLKFDLLMAFFGASVLLV